MTQIHQDADPIHLADDVLPVVAEAAVAFVATGAYEILRVIGQLHDTNAERLENLDVAEVLAKCRRILETENDAGFIVALCALYIVEATSALDFESEAIIQQNMRYICKGRTVFIIAHRLSAVRMASRILVIDKGRMVEQGSHRQLFELGGYYAAMCRHQSAAIALTG